jgi:hypothetical protein
MGNAAKSSVRCSACRSSVSPTVAAPRKAMPLAPALTSMTGMIGPESTSRGPCQLAGHSIAQPNPRNVRPNSARARRYWSAAYARSTASRQWITIQMDDPSGRHPLRGIRAPLAKKNAWSRWVSPTASVRHRTTATGLAPSSRDARARRSRPTRRSPRPSGRIAPSVRSSASATRARRARVESSTFSSSGAGINLSFGQTVKSLAGAMAADKRVDVPRGDGDGPRPPASEGKIRRGAVSVPLGGVAAAACFRPGDVALSAAPARRRTETGGWGPVEVVQETPDGRRGRGPRVRPPA